MGGADTEIDASTTDVLLEMAWFLPISVTKSSRRLRLRSEASARFEKGTDPEVIDLAHRRFAELLAGTGARLEAGTVDVRGELPDRRPVHVRTGRLNRLLGTDLDAPRIAELLEPIGFAASVVGDDTEVTIPSWRYDSTGEIDVVEEVARLHGYSSIGRHRAVVTAPRPPDPAPARAARASGRCSRVAGSPRRCRSRSWRRVTSSACGLPGDGIEITNPLVAEESVLRTSLLPGLVKALATNAARRNTGVGLWEIGHVFRRPHRRPRHRAAARRARDARRGAGRSRRHGRGRPRVACGGRAPRRPGRVASSTARSPGCTPPARRRSSPPPARSSARWASSIPLVLEAHGIAERVGWLEVDLGAVAELPRDPHVYRPGEHLPVERRRPRLRGRRRGARHRGRGGHRAGRRERGWPHSACSTSTAAPASPPAGAASPTRCGSTPPTTR